MGLPERVCQGCGAINRVSAEDCWRCLEPLAESTREPVSSPAPSVGATSPQTATSA